MIKEIIAQENKEAKQSTMEKLDKFKSENGTSFPEAKAFADNLFNGENDGYYSDYSDRYDRTPKNGENGSWTDERGESKYIPSDATEKGRAGIAKLAEYGMDGIEYKNCEPDYSKCSEGTVQIENMTANRPDNFAQANEKLAEQWNDKARDGRTDWTDEDVDKWRKENKLSWHECCDTKTMHLVSQDIHGDATSVFPHLGGVAECKARDSIGGGFDEQSKNGNLGS